MEDQLKRFHDRPQIQNVKPAYGLERRAASVHAGGNVTHCLSAPGSTKRVEP